MAFKLSKQDIELISNFAETLNCYPKRDDKGEFIKVQYATWGKELIAEFVKDRKTPPLVEGEPINPDNRYTQEGYLLTDPKKWLIKQAKKKGPKALPDLVKAYIKEGEEVQKQWVKEQEEELLKPQTKLELPTN